MDGYKGQKVDLGWWRTQINEGEKWRKDKAYEAKWPRWRRYYRGEWLGGIMPVNLFFTLANTIVPRVYFRNPTVSITPAQPGLDALVFARILQRIDNKMLSMLGVKQQFKRMVRDAFLFGTGVAKWGYGSYYGAGQGRPAPVTTANGYLEYAEDYDAMPFVRRISPDCFVVPKGTCYLEDNTRWAAYKMWRPIADLREDPRFKVPRGMMATRSSGTGTSSDPKHAVDMVELYEVQDRKTRQVFVFSPTSTDSLDGEALYQGEDPLQELSQFSCLPLVFNDTDDAFWGLPDSQILEPYQREINEIRTQIMMHRRLSLVKILATKDSIDKVEIEKMLDPNGSPVIFMKTPVAGNIEKFQVSSIPQDFFQNQDLTWRDVRDTVGFSRNQMGEFNSKSADTTATEANIVQQAAEIRIEERRDIAADLLVSFVNKLHQVLFATMKPDQVVDLVGPGGAQVWVKYSPELLAKGRYNITVDPDSTVPQTQQLREQRALSLYNVLKTNPMIDPVKLTQYLLSELSGAQFDDMLRIMPMAGQGTTPGNPMSVGDYGGMLASQMQQAGNQNSEALNQAS